MTAILTAVIGLLSSGVAGLIVKAIGALGIPALEAFTKIVTTKDTEATKQLGTLGDAVKTAATTEVEMRKTASNERIALWSDTWYRTLIYLILFPPVFYFGAIFADSVFSFHFDVLRAPEQYETFGMNVIYIFIGGSTLGMSLVGAIKQWRK